MMHKRVISTGTLLLTSVSAIIGSGWLFASYYAAAITGPSSILSWIIACMAIILVAFTFAELSAFVPVTGTSIRVLRYTHGQFVGYIFSWITWAVYFSLMAVEVQAVIQYGSFFYPSLVHMNGSLTGSGYGIATILMLLVSIINFYSLLWLLRCNNMLTILKIIIPLFLVAAILLAQYPVSHNTMRHMTFAPQGLKGVLSAMTTGGIVFAFNGFRQATELAGEAKNPERSIPIAVIGGMLICLVVYLALQYAFLASVVTNAHLKDWQSLKLSGINSPFAIVLIQEKLNHLMPVLYLGAIIGPFAAALMYGSSGARALYAISQNGSLPKWFSDLNKKGLPIKAVAVNFVLGMTLFAPFPGWASMATFLTSLMVLTYISTPVCLLCLHHAMPNTERYFKLPCRRLWGFAAFYICALLIYWTGWNILWKLFIGLGIGFIVLLLYRLSAHKREELFHLDWKASLWVWCFFIGMAIISYYGSFGGRGLLPFGWDFMALAILSLLSLWLGVSFAIPNAEIQQSIQNLKDPKNKCQRSQKVNLIRHSD